MRHFPTTWPRPGRTAIVPVWLSLALVWLSFALIPAPVPAGQADAPAWRLPAAERIVAMADWHGDLEAARRALRLAGAIDDEDRWIGGDLVVVQTGDLLDRGDQERAILDLVDRLRREAAAAGGALHVLLGNHELMNVLGDFRYVTDGGWTEFADLDHADLDPDLAALPPLQRPRAAAFRPGGRYARQLAEYPVVLVIGRYVFVHGGVLPGHLAYGLERLNRETSAWLRGEGPQPALLQERESPVWARTYCKEPDTESCSLLDQVLAELDCDRMFAGHTIQRDGVTPGCDRRIWCLDTGASSYYLGPAEAVEITAEMVRILR